MTARIVVVDNYDSFTQNVVHALAAAGADCDVKRHDAGDADAWLDPIADGYVISAGPCTPARAGGSLDLVALLSERFPHVPLLGLCLGHQVIAAAAGASLRRARVPMHGKLTRLSHDRSGILDAVPSPLSVARYNSLVIDEETLPKELVVTGWDEHGDLMSLRHTELPHTGLQFHPESWLCPEALPLFSAWVAHAARVRQGEPR